MRILSTYVAAARNISALRYAYDITICRTTGRDSMPPEQNIACAPSLLSCENTAERFVVSAIRIFVSVTPSAVAACSASANAFADD